MPHIINYFLDGLIYLYFARNALSDEDKQKWAKASEGSLETMKDWMSISKWGFSNKCYLLEAEYHFLQSNDALALEKYEASVAEAQSHRFVHEEGLAHYLCGQFHLARGRRQDAAQQFVHAKACYERWGAYRLVRQMEGIVLSSS